MSTKILDRNSVRSACDSFRIDCVDTRPPDKDLADFVTEVMDLNGWTLDQVAKQSGGGISRAQIGHVKSRHVLGPSLTIKSVLALSKGLRVNNEVLYRIAVGLTDKTAEEKHRTQLAQLAASLNSLSERARRLALRQLQELIQGLEEFEDQPATPKPCPSPVSIPHVGKLDR